jgi:hypothetical protein
MTSRLATTVALALLVAVPPAFAQDGVIVGNRFVGATRHFGADLGPVPVDLTWPLCRAPVDGLPRHSRPQDGRDH